LISPGRSGTQRPAKGAVIQTLGSIQVAIKDGYVVSAIDPSGSKWSAADLQKSKPGYRRLTHAMVLLAAMAPISITMASAHQPSPAQQRIVLQPTPADHPEALKDIPPDPSPSPTPSAVPAPAQPAAPPKPAAPAPPVAVAPSQQAVADIIRAAAAKYGADANQMIRVARCESGLNPNAYNRGGGYSGLFQFAPSTFYAHGGHNIWDAADQSDVAARMFAAGQSYQWGCK
jgi:soluble lytic murein transglycosylase-like protein